MTGPLWYTYQAKRGALYCARVMVHVGGESRTKINAPCTIGMSKRCWKGCTYSTKAASIAHTVTVFSCCPDIRVVVQEQQAGDHLDAVREALRLEETESLNLRAELDQANVSTFELFAQR